MKIFTPLFILVDPQASKSLIVIEMLILIPLMTFLCSYILSNSTWIEGWVQRSITMSVVIFAIGAYSSSLRE